MTIREILATSKTIAVVGLSDRAMRPSYSVAKYLVSHGYRVIPVNPNCSSALGLKSYARLEDIPEPVDIVDVFRRSEFVSELVSSSIKIGARCVWMQVNVVDEAAAARARDAGLFVVMDECIRTEHARL